MECTCPGCGQFLYEGYVSDTHQVTETGISTIINCCYHSKASAKRFEIKQMSLPTLFEFVNNIQANQKIQAIKLLRAEMPELGLRELKDIVDYIADLRVKTLDKSS